MIAATAVAGAGSGRGPPATPAVGLDLGEGPRLPRHPLRRRPGRARRGQHHARGHAAGGRRPRRDPRANRSTAPTQVAARCWTELAALGIDYEDVVQTLEDQAVAAFDASWDQLSQRLSAALHDAPTRQE